MEPPPGAQKRTGPRGKGPEVQELFRTTSKQPAGMCGAPALEAPPWTPLCANYVVVQVWRGTRQFRGISPRRRAERGTFDSSGGSEESTLRRADLSNPGPPLDAHPTSGRGPKAPHYLRPDPHQCASPHPDRDPLPNPPSVGVLRDELHRLARGGGGPPTRDPTAQPSPRRDELASRTPLADAALVLLCHKLLIPSVPSVGPWMPYPGPSRTALTATLSS